MSTNYYPQEYDCVVVLRQRIFAEAIVSTFAERISGFRVGWVPAAVRVNESVFENVRLVIHFADDTPEATELKLHIIQCAKPHVPRIVVVDRPRPYDRAILAKLPCHGYVTLGEGIAQLIKTAHLVMQGHTVISPEARDIFKNFSRIDASDEGEQWPLNSCNGQLRLSNLTAQEAGVFECIAQGMDDTECAAELGLSEKTILNIKSRVNKKLGIRSTVDMLRLAIRWGMV